MKLSVIIPVYNERNTIEELLRRVLAVPIDKEIIIIDDGSTDGSREYLQQLQQELADDAGRIRILFQRNNCGKGAALRMGFLEARGEIVIVQDADLELDPSDCVKLIQPIENGEADVVYGSRFLAGRPPHEPTWHFFGNRFLTALSNQFTRLGLSDVWTGYKAFRGELLLDLTLQEDRFGFEPEVTAKIARRRWRVREVPVSYLGRNRLEGKKIGWKDLINGIWCTLRYSLFN